MARPMPWKPPLRLLMAELMPITLPSMLMSGPPLLPGLMAASVCRKSSYMFIRRLRPLALMMPERDGARQPERAPTASTRSPISIASLSPNSRYGSGSLECDADDGQVGLGIGLDVLGQ